MSQENVEVVMRVLAAINRRDMEAAMAELHHGAKYVDHRASSREVFQGTQAFRSHFSAIWQAAPDTHILAEAIAHPGDLVVARQTISASDAGGRPTERVRWVTRIVRDGRISRVEIFESRSDALKAAGLSE